MSTSKGKGDARAKDVAYEDSPQQVKNREARNRARAAAERAGKVHKGDGQDVDHKKPLIKGGSTDVANTRVVSEKANRSWRAGKSGYDPSK